MANNKLNERELDLRGTIADELVAHTPGFSPENARLLRRHGVFQQDNRDERHADRNSRQYEFMVRVRATGGKLTACQLLGLLDLTEQLGDGQLHVTSRQGIQLAGIEKTALRPALRCISDLQLSTLATGGDLNCNVVCCPAPHGPGSVRDDLQATADELATCLMPRAGDYDDIWLGNRPAVYRQSSGTNATNDVISSIDGRASNPHKFKIGLAIANDNCTDVYAQDLGLLAVTDNARVVGYNVLVGGNMRNYVSVAARSATLARPLAYVASDDLLSLVSSIIAVYREHGDRSDHNRARMRYLIQDWGLERFKRAVEDVFGRSLEPPRPVEVVGREDHLGWHRQNDREWFVGLHVENGHIADGAQSKLKSALRTIADRFSVRFRLTPQRNILVCDVPSSDCCHVDALLARHHVRSVGELSNVRRYSMGCPGLPNCSAAITESQRLLDRIINELESEVFRLGLAEEPFTLRITGCPFGCTRSHLADIALVGRAADPETGEDKYAIFLGGDRLGRRLNTLYRDLVPADQIISALRGLLLDYRGQRLAGETFGDFYVRNHTK